MNKGFWMICLCSVFLSGASGSMFFTKAQTALNRSIGATDIDLEDETEEAKLRARTLREMENLIAVAKEAGFTEEELKEITVEREGEKINVWEFIQQEKERLAMAKKAQEEAAKKRYITVQDITEDLILKESDQISNLRDNLIFSGEDE